MFNCKSYFIRVKHHFYQDSCLTSSTTNCLRCQNIKSFIVIKSINVKNWIYGTPSMRFHCNELLQYIEKRRFSEHLWTISCLTSCEINTNCRLKLFQYSTYPKVISINLFLETCIIRQDNFIFRQRSVLSQKTIFATKSAKIYFKIRNYRLKCMTSHHVIIRFVHRIFHIALFFCKVCLRYTFLNLFFLSQFLWLAFPKTKKAQQWRTCRTNF